jgi:predicted amidohydrolase YtcJ
VRAFRFAIISTLLKSWEIDGLSASAQTPDLILVHGKILTVDAKDSIAQAVAIRQGKIVAVGSDKTNPAACRIQGEVIDLHGRTATPGLIDSHAHIATGGVDELYSVSLSDAATVDEVKSPGAGGGRQVEAGEWLTGAGWDEGKLAERRYILASDLDKVAPAQSCLADAHHRTLWRRQP